MGANFIGVAGGVVAALFPLVNPIGAVPVFMSLSAQLDSQARRRQAVRTAIFVFSILIVSALAGRLVLQIFGLSVGTLQVAGGLIVANTAWKMATGAPRLSSTERKAVARSQRRARRSLSDKLRENLELISEGHLPGASSHLEPPKSASAAGTGAGGEASGTDTAPAALGAVAFAGEASTGACDAPVAPSVPAAPPAPARKAAVPDFAFSPMAMPLLAGPGSIGVVVGFMSQTATLAGDLGIFVGLVVISLIVAICLLASEGLVRLLGDSGILAMQRIFGFIVLAIAVALVAHGIATLFGLELFILVPS